MTYEQLFAYGKLGIVIRLSKNEAGIQIPGEEDIRWIPLTNLQEFAAGVLEVVDE